MYDKEALEKKLRTHGPDRIWNGSEGLHPQMTKAKEIKIDYCLVRKDGWSLGFTKEHTASAYALWEGITK